MKILLNLLKIATPENKPAAYILSVKVSEEGTDIKWPLSVIGKVGSNEYILLMNGTNMVGSMRITTFKAVIAVRTELSCDCSPCRKR